MHALDPRTAVMYFDIVFEDYNLEEDLGSYMQKHDPARYRWLRRKLAKFKTADGYDLASFAVACEDKAYKTMEKRLRPLSLSNEGYSTDGLVCKVFVDDVADVVKVRSLFDREGRDYTSDYTMSAGICLFPQGVNGPVYRTDSTSFDRSNGDLDDWIEVHAPPSPPKRRKRSR